MNPFVLAVLGREDTPLNAQYLLKNDANDTYGNYNGIVSGATFNGTSAYFDGVDDYIDLQHTFDMKNGSFTAWVNMRDITSNSIVFGTIPGSSHAEGYLVAIGAGKFGLIASQNTSYWTTLYRTPFTFENIWKHIGMVVQNGGVEDDGAMSINLYIDGVLQTPTDDTVGNFTNPSHTQIGFVDRSIHGDVSKVDHTTAFISSTEMEDLYNSQKLDYQA